MILEDRDYNNIKEHVNLVLKKSLFGNRKITSCPHCKSNQYIKHGKFDGIQRFKCKNCKKTFSESTNLLWSYSKKDPQKWIKFIELMLEQKVLKECSDKLDININTAFLWRHKVLNELIKKESLITLNGAVHMIKTSMKESFKGSKNIKTDIRENIIIVSARSENDSMISISLSKRLWLWNVFESKVYSKFSQGGYIVPYQDRYIYLAAKRYNKSLENVLYKDDDVIRNFNKLANGWFKTFHGIATRYLDGYLSWLVLFFRNKSFKDVEVIYELMSN